MLLRRRLTLAMLAAMAIAPATSMALTALAPGLRHDTRAVAASNLRNPLSAMCLATRTSPVDGATPDRARSSSAGRRIATRLKTIGVPFVALGMLLAGCRTAAGMGGGGAALAEPAASTPARPPASGGAGRAGEPPPPAAEHAPGGRGAWTPPAETPASVREAVGGVASAAGQPPYGTPRALRAILGMLAVVSQGVPAAGVPIARMREEVDLLARLGPIDLDRADRVKAALDRGVEAMRALARSHGAGWLEGWVAAAAAAAGLVDPGSPMGLQRAAVQDALRTLADAVLVADQFAHR